MQSDPPVSVERISLTLVDESRPTPANATYEGARHRVLETVVSYPVRQGRAVEGPMPFVVFATGYGGTSTNYVGLYDHWVRAGYVVAAPTFPLSGKDAPGGTSGADLASQPGDIAFVVREVLERARTRDSELYGFVDAERVALAGKSFGAITVLEAGYNPAEQVPNIKAVIALTGVALEGAQFEAVDTPLLLEHGDQDELVPCSASQQVYERARSPKFFVTLFGSDHVSAFHGGTSPAEVVVERTTIDFLDRYVSGDAEALARLQHEGDVPGVASIAAAP
jgi:dienelactone hydrolase